MHESQSMQRFLYHCTSAAHVQALRVVAPGAAQRAALEEHGGADARPVLGGEALQVQNGAGDVCRRNSIVLNWYHIWWLSRAMISSCSSLPMVVK